MRYIFGHGRSFQRDEFANKHSAINYLLHELPDERAFRYRTTYAQRDVDAILFSFRGELLAELVVADVQSPQPEDITAYAKTKTVYLIDEIRLFANPTLRAADFGLTNYQYGKVVADAVYEQIIASTGGFSQIRKRHP